MFIRDVWCGRPGGADTAPTLAREPDEAWVLVHCVYAGMGGDNEST